MRNSKRLPTTSSSFPIKSIFRTKSAQEPIFRKCLDLNDCLDSTNKSVQKSHTKNNYARVLAECKMQPNTRGRGYQCVCLHYHQCTLAVAGKIIQIKFSVLALYKGKFCQMVSSLLCQLVSNQIIELSAFASVVVSLGTIDLRVETRDYRMNDLMILLITKKLISFWNFSYQIVVNNTQ